MPVPPSQVLREPNWEGVTAGLTSLSTAFVWGSILLALVVIALAGGWGYLVRGWAKDEAAKVAKEIMDGWLATEAPRILREGRDLLKPPAKPLDSAAADKEADKFGDVAG